MSATPDIPRQAGQALAVLQRRLGPALLAVYLHGSARGGGLRPQSDVDLLAVTDGPLAADARGPLTRDLMALSAYPARSESMRPLEILVFDRHDLDPLPYPARSEFVYGEWLRPGFEAGGVPLPLADPSSPSCWPRRARPRCRFSVPRRGSCFPRCRNTTCGAPWPTRCRRSWPGSKAMSATCC